MVNMKLRLTCFLVLFFIGLKPFAQTKQVQHLQQVWLAYNNQTRVSDKFGFWLDLHLRTKDDFFTDLSQTIIRPGVTYYFNDATKFTVGYAWINIYPADNHSKVTQPEHRIWQQLQWHTKYGRLRTMQWLRLEERYRREIVNDSTLGEGYDFNFRWRYNFLLQIPLTKRPLKAGDLSVIINDEVHINSGKKIVYNYFDQNRFFVGLAVNVSAQDNIQFGYMNLFQQLSAGNKYKSINAARVYFFHNLDFRKK
jgi:hypothetical protein